MSESPSAGKKPKPQESGGQRPLVPPKKAPPGTMPEPPDGEPVIITRRGKPIAVIKIEKDSPEKAQETQKPAVNSLRFFAAKKIGSI